MLCRCHDSSVSIAWASLQHHRLGGRRESLEGEAGVVHQQGRSLLAAQQGRRLRQSLPGYYPGQDTGVQPQLQPQPSGASGEPRPLFFGPAAPSRGPEVSGQQQRLQVAPSAETGTFSAVDIGGPSVVVDNNSPGDYLLLVLR